MRLVPEVGGIWFGVVKSEDWSARCADLRCEVPRSEYPYRGHPVSADSERRGMGSLLSDGNVRDGNGEGEREVELCALA